MPEDKNHPYRLDLKSEKTIKTGNRIMVALNQYNGKIMLDSETDFPNIGNSYVSWITPIHFGTFGGWPTRILAFIGGLIPLVLFITGFIVWWPRYKHQKKKKKLSSRHAEAYEKTNYFRRNQKLNFREYTYFYIRKGFKYALMTLAVSFLSGILYGIFSGIVWQPALFGVTYIGITVMLNFWWHFWHLSSMSYSYFRFQKNTSKFTGISFCH
ncbi:MAG: PepSY-associated TM helix domain-containing protein [Edaphocola sp.]